MTSIPIETYQDAIRDAVCGVCVSFAEDKQNPGRCMHENSGDCRVFAHLDELVEVVAGVDSGSIDAYCEALRRRVCSNCDHQNARGICDLRDSRDPVPTWCTLDTYFNIIVGTIEDVGKDRTAKSEPH
jgi:hypothetical protein